MKLINGDLILNVADMDHIYGSAQELGDHLETLAPPTEDGEEICPVLPALLACMDLEAGGDTYVDDFRAFDVDQEAIEEAMDAEGTEGKLAILGVKRIILDMGDAVCSNKRCKDPHAAFHRD